MVLARSRPMRHASQLCRGLAEASRSLERPYIPRHVPLPSSSYSAAAQSSAVPTAPKPSAASNRTEPEANVSKNNVKLGDAQASYLFERPTTQRQPSVTTELQNQQSQKPALEPPSVRSSHVKRPHRLPPRSASRYHRHMVSIDGRSASAVNSQLGHASGTNILSRQTSSNPSDPRSHPAKGPHTTRVTPSHEIECLVAAYPCLSKSQARLLLQTFHQIRALSSHPPSVVLAWYEDFVWTTERQTQGSEKIESPESLSLLLRFAHQRNDLRSLLRIENRAARFYPRRIRASSDTPASSVSPMELGTLEVDGVCIWPEPDEDPLRLAYNLKVAFAAREGNWVKVAQLMDQAHLSSSKTLQASATRRPGFSTGRSKPMLDAIGWGSLLRFGLGVVQKPESAGFEPVRAAPARPSEADHDEPTAPTLASGIAPVIDSIPDDIEDKRAKRAKEDETQRHAKRSVTKRLLPYLLRHNSASKLSGRAAETARATAARPKESTTPTWLLHSVLTQLAKRGDTASTLRIVQLALSEKAILEHLAQIRGGGTSILNLALVACDQNHTVSLTETLRIFNTLTGSQLGMGVTGPAVLAQPTLSDAGQRAQQPDPSSAQNCREVVQTEEAVSEGGTIRDRIAPNEESLVLVLKKVRHPLFRAAWARKLVDEFQQLFPDVKLSGRTFRIIIDKCVVPARKPPPEAPPAEATQPSPAVSREHLVASGRRGRRLRQQAASANLVPNQTCLLAETKGKRPNIKQSILSRTLADMLERFGPGSQRVVHRSTTNRRRFEYTLLQARRALEHQQQLHEQEMRSGRAGDAHQDGRHRHHTAAIEQIEALLRLIAQVRRLGRSQEARRKKADRFDDV